MNEGAIEKLLLEVNKQRTSGKAFQDSNEQLNRVQNEIDFSPMLKKTTEYE